eukprot:7239478-Prymnesium_polylepis.1
MFNSGRGGGASAGHVRHVRGWEGHSFVRVVLACVRVCVHAGARGYGRAFIRWCECGEVGKGSRRESDTNRARPADACMRIRPQATGVTTPRGRAF